MFGVIHLENENNFGYNNNQGYQNNRDYLVDRLYQDNRPYHQNSYRHSRISQYNQDANRQSQNNQKQPSKPIDSKLAIIVVQVVMCSIIVVACLVLKSFCGDLFSQLKTWYIANVEDKTSVKQVLDSSSRPSQTSSRQATEEVSSDQSSTESSPSSSETSSAGSSSQADSSGKSDSLGKQGATSSTTAAAGVPEGGKPQPVDNSYDFNVVRQTMARAGSVNSLYVPVKGTVSSRYGYRTDPISGIYSFHSGLDIAANTGTEIHAAMDGVVQEAGRDTYYGNYVVIKHSNSFKTLYGHCSSLKVKAGQAVKAGDVIALVGSTGRSTGPHLHFEVEIGGQTVNPTWLLGEDFK